MLFVLRYHQDDLLDLRLNEEQGLLDLQLLAFGAQEFDDLSKALLEGLAALNEVCVVCL